mgnify:CR=1 FL=1
MCKIQSGFIRKPSDYRNADRLIARMQAYRNSVRRLHALDLFFAYRQNASTFNRPPVTVFPASEGVGMVFSKMAALISAGVAPELMDA